MNKLQEIFKAWNIAFNPNSAQLEKAAKRLEVCNTCEHRVENLGISRCDVCGCALKGKVFSPVEGACPKGKWDKEQEKTVVMEDIKDKSIFVQIASYRDPQLLPTLRDLFAKAKYQESLRVCIAWQHSPEDEWDTLSEFEADERVTIIDIPHTESKGACWARNTVQQHYKGEAYTLQLDSHHRFIENWDEELITMYENLRLEGYEKPLLTSYISSFDPDNDPAGRTQETWWMTFDRFTPEGVVFFLPAGIPENENRTKPVRGRFYSAHFAFTTGEFCKEVQHDPSFYFHGEEITIAVRAYTHGYDIFHPHKTIAWHEYTRKGRSKHWDEHPDWVDMNNNTHSRTRKILGIDGEIYNPEEFGIYGLGNKRTVEDYERFAGIRFRDRSAQQFTLDNNLPPNPNFDTEEEYNDSFLPRFKHCIDIHKGSFPEDDYTFAAIIFEREDGSVIYRKDATDIEIREQKRKEGDWMNFWREYYGEQPYKWIVWPHSESKGWGDKVETLMNGQK